VEPGQVSLQSGEKIKADVVLVATGIRPNTELAEKAGIDCDNGILVDGFLQTSAPDIYASGDVARWPEAFTEKSARIEHWVVAQRQGQTAARNMLGQKVQFKDIPFFWSTQFDVTINYIGMAKNWSSTEIYGDLGARNCSVAYIEQDRINAVLTLGRDRQNLLIEKAMEDKDQEKLREILRADDREKR
jgi:NADPH-dependent 2,4-dienoyl-CoA reductase/sulfur reductase-like enzyme